MARDSFAIVKHYNLQTNCCFGISIHLTNRRKYLNHVMYTDKRQDWVCDNRLAQGLLSVSSLMTMSALQSQVTPQGVERQAACVMVFATISHTLSRINLKKSTHDRGQNALIAECTS